MKKLTATLLAGTMAVSLLAGCGSTTAPADTAPAAEAGAEKTEDAPAAEAAATTGPSNVLRLCLASEPDHLDPALNSSVDGACLASNSFVGLYTSAADGSIVPALADGEPEVSEDGLTYTVTMKDGLKWSDGTELTAKDIEYSWKRAADPNTASDYGYLFDLFARNGDELDVTASEDGKTITWNLTAPCPYMMSLLAFPVFMPVPQFAVEAAADWETNPGAWAMEAGFVSNGAFTLKEWNHDESMVYVKNPNFYDADNVKLEELHFMLSADDTAILAAYNAGDLDYIDSVPNDEISTLKEQPDFKVAENLGTYYVAFNVNSKLFEGKTPEQANKMRLAFNYLIDRDYIVENIGQTNQQPATSYIPAGMSDGNGGEFKANDADYSFPVEDGYYALDTSIDEAVALLKEAGFEFDENNMLSDSTPLNITYLTNDGSGHVAIAQAIQQDLATVGIQMDIQQEDWQTFLNDRKNGNFDVAREGWLADYDDPINMLEMFASNSGNNDPQFGVNPTSAAPDWSKYDELVTKIKAETDLAAREKMMHEAEDMLMSTGAVVPIYYYNDLYMQKTNVDGIYATIFGTKYFMYAEVK